MINWLSVGRWAGLPDEELLVPAPANLLLLVVCPAVAEERSPALAAGVELAAHGLQRGDTPPACSVQHYLQPGRQGTVDDAAAAGDHVVHSHHLQPTPHNISSIACTPPWRGRGCSRPGACPGPGLGCGQARMVLISVFTDLTQLCFKFPSLPCNPSLKHVPFSIMTWPRLWPWPWLRSQQGSGRHSGSPLALLSLNTNPDWQGPRLWTG